VSVPRKLFSPFNVISAALLAVSVLALQAVQRTPPTPEPPKLDLTERQTLKVKVYFTDPQVQALKPETRTVQVSRTNTRSVAQAAVDVWARGPFDKSFLGVVPAGTPAPKVYLRGQHYYVDLPEAYTKLRYGASGERMLLCTLTRTLLEQKGQDVTFLVSGQNVEALGRIDLTQPFAAGDCADQ